ncbi:hypothetical protein [Desulfomonile tiedjei]|uniref:Uncharacterized protein n=1 Tax=Desulfomonile tiedjei (strain ATCC 49306 / DSM 6799 / DCB-1) TaxID=706587 RepID=I4C0B6_DESTA|nr:hypothetical protein [Desulfomonile tiedjei]AFM23007.1 hypothetical protein Desti_0265 [Desulfomonile tiedjei DSM 6799]
MIDVKTAVDNAVNYAATLYGKGWASLVPGLLVEEVELSDDEQFWYVTLGWDADRLGTSRIYKSFKVRADSGDVVAMKIRTLQ